VLSLTPPRFAKIAILCLLAGCSLRASYPIQGTFLNFYRNLTPELWSLEFQYMRAVDINTVVIVSTGHLRADSRDVSGYSLAPDGLLYPSDWVAASERPSRDLLETILSLADQYGMNVYLGSLQTATDWTDGTEFAALRTYNQRVSFEVIQRYSQHPSLRGWYFTQEIWMNWVKEYGPAYSGTALLADWAADMKSIDPARTTTASVVVKKIGSGEMPGLTPAELQDSTTSFLDQAHIDILMPQDGIGAGAGAPSLDELPEYFAAMQTAAQATNTALWSAIETYTADPNLTSERFPPAPMPRIQDQVNKASPYVSGYVSWIFGDDMSPQATYYPVEASDLNRHYQQAGDVLPLESYQLLSPPSSLYPDTATPSKLSDRTGGGYDGFSLGSWVGFANGDAYTPIQIVGDLGSVNPIQSVRALTQSWLSSGIYRPAQMDIEISLDGSNWAPFGSTNSFPQDTDDFAIMWGEVAGAASARYVRWTFSCRDWFFLAELEVIGSGGSNGTPASRLLFHQ
jgi:uncharacterized protein DUF4434